MPQSTSPSETSILPGILPVFPLSGVLLLPRGVLPLNIFETRYLAMVDQALHTDRLIGMIQPEGVEGETGPDDAPIKSVGCAGRIVRFEEKDDGRYEITLKGISRFRVQEELPLENRIRRVKAEWGSFAEDLKPQNCLDVDREKLLILLKDYFTQEGLSCCWDSVKEASDEKLITCLSMICPFGAKEKQALLEAECCRERAQLFMTLLELSVQENGGCGQGVCRH